MAVLRPDFEELVNELVPALIPSWYGLGRYLGVSKDTLEIIMREEQEMMQLLRMLRVWISDYPEGGWSDIVEALKVLKHYRIAMDIEDKYIDKGRYAYVMSLQNHTL